MKPWQSPLALLAFFALSGADPVRHAVFVEGGGSALAYSLNYDIRLYERLSLRAGYGYFKLPGAQWADSDNHPIPFHLFPVIASHLLGKGNHLLETGTGPVFVLGEKDRTRATDYRTAREGHALLWNVTLGYRYQPRRGPFFRAAFTPLFGPLEETFLGGDEDADPNGPILRMFPAAGISLGYAF